ncbi:hypothetical protein DICPUDRAFT_96563 [Dictyostelium purpureum]|uniref:Hpc2-related domain-containing protein n=1 Tax=Dictyostelium purpureum TaxID=5786 RepID=F0Z9G4_DICPU|nr:uncharacterized protein DICPUDRAFT_96563 [Dictyostelium purpureum]EGC39407.1 hypothetical protein DICPUDRAFT_96563 [Dictyostelium purpureum]|eukprot:XP_003284081.1 hypothetical protein DICPUDRAFT_96563 [Dictyostelium purpureum]
MSIEDRNLLNIPSTSSSSRLINFNNNNNNNNSFSNINTSNNINNIIRKDTMLASSLGSTITNGNPSSPNQNNDDSILSNNSSTNTNNNPINNNESNQTLTPNKGFLTPNTQTQPKTPKTMRFEVNLKSMKGEVDYKQLVKNYIQDQNKEKISSSFYGAAPSNDYRENFEIEKELNTLTNPKNRLTEVIDKIERINTLGSNINYMEDGENSEDQYDEDDSFIDDSQIIDFDDELETNYGGFFVNQGEVEHKERTFIDYEDDDDYEIEMMANGRGSSSNKHVNGMIGIDKAGAGISSTTAVAAPSISSATTTTATVKKRKFADDQSSANKKHKIVLLDPSSPEIESLLAKLEEEIKMFQKENLDLKLLPKKEAPLLAKLYEKLRRTNTAGYIPSSILNRLSTLWGIKEKTIKVHLKKAWEDNGQKTQTKSIKSIDKLNELMITFKNSVEKEFADQVFSNNNKAITVSIEGVEKPLEYTWSRDSRERVFEIVKLNKEIIDLKNSTEVIDAEKTGRPPVLIIEKTSRSNLYKKIVNLLPDTGITPKSLSNAYTTIRTIERKRERKLEEAAANNEEKNKPQLTTTTTTTTSMMPPAPSSNKDRSSDRSKDRGDKEKSERDHHSSSHHRSSDRSDKEKSDRKDRDYHKSSSSSHQGSDHHKSSSSSSGDKEKRRDRDRERDRSDRDKEKSKDRSDRKSSSSSSSSSGTKDYSSSSSKKEHSSSSSKESEKDRERRKEREREKERERRKEREREKEREKDKDKDKKIKDVDLDIIHDMNSYKKKTSSSNSSSLSSPPTSSSTTSTSTSNII